MKPSESDHPLRSVSFIVLGILATAGLTTSYKLEHNARIFVGFFQPFPHSRLYVEPRKLVEAGLVDVESEEGGRRRQVYSIMEGGLRVLHGWLQRPVGIAQTRDPAPL